MKPLASSTEDEPSSPTSSEERIEELEQRIRNLESQIEKLRQQPEEDRGSPDSLWTPQEVADYLNVSKRTVERIIDRGRLKPLRIRAQRRFEPESVRAYVREHCTSKGGS